MWHGAGTRQASSPQALRTPVAAIADMKRNDLAAYGVHRDPAPLLVGFLLDKAGQFIRFHCQALHDDVVCAGDGVDMQMIRQRLNALHEKPQSNADGTTHASQRNPFQQQPFNQHPGVLWEEILLAALHKLASTIVAVMIVLAVINVPIALVLRGLTPGTDMADDHGVLLTSTR